MLKRFLPVIVTVSILLCCIAVVPASAVAIDYTDYITDIGVDDFGGDVVTCTFDRNLFSGFYLYDRTSGVNTWFNGPETMYDFTVGHQYSLMWRPFQANGNYFLLENLPAGTFIAIQFMSGYTAEFSDTAVTSGFIQYYGPSGYMSSVPMNTNGWASLCHFNCNIEPPVHANRFTMIADFNLGTVTQSGSFWFGVQEVKMAVDVSSLYIQQVQSGKTNKLLTAIENKLAENGQTLQDVLNTQQQTNSKLDNVISQQDRINEYLDDFKNYEVEGARPDGSDVVDDYESAEDQLMDSVSGGSSQFEDMTLTAWDRIYTYQQSFLAFSSIFGLFADIPFIQSLLYISLTLGSFAFLLGLGSSVAGYFRRGEAEQRRISNSRRKG